MSRTWLRTRGWWKFSLADIKKIFCRSDVGSKKLSCVSYGSLKRFPHTFTNVGRIEKVAHHQREHSIISSRFMHLICPDQWQLFCPLLFIPLPYTLFSSLNQRSFVFNFSNMSFVSFWRHFIGDLYGRVSFPIRSLLLHAWCTLEVDSSTPFGFPFYLSVLA